MAAASHRLMVKYGLGHSPTDAEVARWAAAVRQLINSGSRHEDAGALAARQVFADYNTRKYASQADTLETLLRLAEQK
jgi:hypothetical protein